MEKKKCSLLEHKDIDSKIICIECNIYMCNKCEKFHSKLFPNHQIFNSDKNINEIFTGFCKEKGHPIKLKFYCKTHNQLCCGICIAKIQKEEIGKHKDCTVCTIEEIKEEKKNKIEQNIKYLKDVSKNLEKSIDELKILFEKINKDKDDLKLKIQNIFTKIRNELNNREEELLLKVDTIFNNTFCDEKILKESLKLPKRINCLLNKIENINNYYNENKISLFVNICINIENEVNNILDFNKNIKKCKDSLNKNIIFNPENENNYIANQLINNIKEFGKLELFNDGNEISKILKENEIDLIKNFIGNQPKFKLLYRATVDGDTKKDFDKKCLNKKPTLALIKNKLGNRFGGYTTQNWNYDKEYDKKDPSAFIFSLDKKKKYNLKKDRRAIHTKTYVIYFGNADFCLQDNFLSNNKGWCNYGGGYYEADLKELSNAEYYAIEEFELYQVLF